MVRFKSSAAAVDVLSNAIDVQEDDFSALSFSSDRSVSSEEVRRQVVITEQEADSVKIGSDSSAMKTKKKSDLDENSSDKNSEGENLEMNNLAFDSSFLQPTPVVDEALRSLDSNDQALVDLRYGLSNGMPLGETLLASELEIPAGDVDQREAEALRALFTPKKKSA